jgi:ubiquinone/menaquinone biosynthesis C-methylase UbiE
MTKKDTSWGNVAGWYDDLLSTDSDSYQSQVILPNLLRLMEPLKGQAVLDLACGSGFFSEKFAAQGAHVIGVDISKELIALAKKKYPSIDFIISSADDLSHIKDHSIDKISIVLAIQNIEHVKNMLLECARVLTPSGRIFIVMNHPVFRNPKETHWGFDEENKKQYRRIDSYLTESKKIIEMHPGKKHKAETVSFHRPLQYYAKLLTNAGFVISRLEEWISHKKSEPGPRQMEENRTRKEIPLFLFLEIIKAK